MDERIRQAIGGNSDALAGLLFDHHDALSRFVCSKIPAKLQSAVDGDDILQQVFVDAFRNVSSLEPKSDRAFYRWLETIAENRLIDVIRANTAQKRGGEFKRVENAQSQQSSVANLFDVISEGIPTASRIVAREEGIQALQVQLAALPDDYRQVLQLRHIEGLTREETAERMNRTEDEVRGLLYRARKKLRDGMGNSSLYLTRK